MCPSQDTTLTASATNVFEDIFLGHNATQVIGSSNSNLTTAKQITVEPGATQCLGDFADTTVQQVLNNRCREPSPAVKTRTNTAVFERHHGLGHPLGSASAAIT
ncbi:hypothetical protein BGW36DRAFT_434151 [Talaromyces proteolyticus]|uniref:Uncharacterized protein n=1 Tax=Talaromyces proteolyticus TaxID=1131652 RepID=A0AAD4PTK3_9EURO|nr:uncharacterized protein BGW36DRAFT_434151 [Talaromyces proteolyticus]KAH8688863.1 hypothetical protein BGW36DRAFT_434151 [Talaromyces proteolyticus]